MKGEIEELSEMSSSLGVGAVVGLRFSEISLANSGHQNLTLKATTQFLDEDNFHALLVLSDFSTTTPRQNILLQIPRVLKS